MLFFLNLDGTVTRSDTDHVYQGQNKVANVELFALISPAQAAIQVAFTLPNGLTTTYAPMSYVGAYSVDESNQKQVHHWKLAVPYNVTEVEGQVDVSFNVLLNNGTSGATLETINQTSYTSSFTVEYSALPIPPTTANEDELEQLLNLLNLYYTQNASLAEKQPFVVGTVKTNTLGANQQASVAVEQSTTPDSEGNYPTNFEFGIPKGTTFKPSIDENGNISWSNDGGKTNPTPQNIKGPTGAPGVTPDIQVEATVDDSVGVPSVEVEKSGASENPQFTFNFKNIKGADGKDASVVQETGQSTKEVMSQKAVTDNLEDKLDKAGGSIAGDLVVGGNFIVAGKTMIVDSETLEVKDKLIKVAKDNVEKLTSPAGLYVPKYNGAQDGALVFNGDGIAQVGDVVLDENGNIDTERSDLQDLTTRKGLQNGYLPQWNSEENTLEDSGKKVSDFAQNSDLEKLMPKSGGTFDGDVLLAQDVAIKNESGKRLLTYNDTIKDVRVGHPDYRTVLYGLRRPVWVQASKSKNLLVSEDLEGMVKSVKVNGTTYSPDSNGLVDLGELGGSGTYVSPYNDIY